MDETYSKIKEKWCYLYRTVDKENNTIDFLLTEKRDKKAVDGTAYGAVMGTPFSSHE
jgi:transposase-like protein